MLAFHWPYDLTSARYRGSLRRFRRMRAAEATIELGEDRFRVSSDVGTTELEWSAVTERWSFREGMLIFFSRAQFMTIPASDLDARSREFIMSKVRSHGAKVA